MATDSLVKTLQQAGFRGDALRTARAVALAESGGRATAYNPNRSTGDDSYGLFQINMLGDLGPVRRRQYGLSSNEDLYDPLTNAKVAYRMSGGGRNWQPWSAFKSGAYRKYLGEVPQDPAPVASTPRPATGGGVLPGAVTPGDAGAGSSTAIQLISSLLGGGKPDVGEPLQLLAALGARRQQAQVAPPAATPPGAGGATLSQFGQARADLYRGVYPQSPLGGFKYRPLGAPGQGTHSPAEGPANWQSDSAWDYGAPPGTPVYATDAGVVAGGYGKLGSSGRFGGSRVNVQGGADDGGEYYAHLAENLAVRPGQRVRRGQLLGYVGNVPGLAPHLHYGQQRI